MRFYSAVATLVAVTAVSGFLHVAYNEGIRIGRDEMKIEAVRTLDKIADDRVYELRTAKTSEELTEIDDDISCLRGSADLLMEHLVLD